MGADPVTGTFPDADSSLIDDSACPSDFGSIGFLSITPAGTEVKY